MVSEGEGRMLIGSIWNVVMRRGMSINRMNMSRSFINSSSSSIIGRMGARKRSSNSSFLGLSRRYIHVTFGETPNPNAKMFWPVGHLVLPPLPSSSSSSSSSSGYMESVSFSNVEKCESSPLAERLLRVNGVSSVLLCKDYITIVKTRGMDWADLEKILQFEISRHFDQNIPNYIPSSSSHESSTPSSSFSVMGDGGDGGAVVAAPTETETEEEEEEDKKDKQLKEQVSSFSSDEKEIRNEDVEKEIESLINMRAKPMVMQDGGDIEFIGFNSTTGVVWVYMKGACEGCPSAKVTVQRGIERMLNFYFPQVKAVKQCDENGEPLSDTESSEEEDDDDEDSSSSDEEESDEEEDEEGDEEKEKEEDKDDEK